MAKEIKMSVDEFLEEHKRLISLLRNPVPEDLEAEADRQEAELKKYDLKPDNDKTAANLPLSDLKNIIRNQNPERERS